MTQCFMGKSWVFLCINTEGRFVITGRSGTVHNTTRQHSTDDGGPYALARTHSARTLSHRSHHASCHAPPRNAGGTIAHAQCTLTHMHHRHIPTSPGQEGGVIHDSTPTRSGHTLLRGLLLIRPRDFEHVPNLPNLPRAHPTTCCSAIPTRPVRDSARRIDYSSEPGAT